MAVNYARNARRGRRRGGRRARAGPARAAVQADVADEAQVLAMFEAVDRGAGPLTALVNNAGIVDVQARVDEMSAERLERMFAINVHRHASCARARRCGA